MLLEKIEDKIKKIEKNINKKNFIYDFLEAYEQPKSTIKRLKLGDYNLSKKTNELIWKKKIYFYQTQKNEDVHDIIDKISKSEFIEKNKIRFIIVTDFKDFLSLDTKTKSTLDIEIIKLSNNVEYFLPLAGFEKAENVQENQADIKAAYKMGKLYDALIKDNKILIKDERERHGLNIFFSRLLFCFFAEDSNIFEKGLFTKSIISHTYKDGSDLTIYLEKLFKILKTTNKSNFPSYLKAFPYVNGGLFKNDYKIPRMSSTSRKLLIESGELNWSSINPDIFGSLMQAVVNPGERKELGMHYTKLTNILKVIKPLFLDDFYNDFKDAGNDKKKLNKILLRIYNAKIFDPACGSGNFLVISYKELYRLEIEILMKLKEIDNTDWLLTKSGIKLNQFYGIEVDDYAHEISKLSLWIAEHQMNTLYKEKLNEIRPTLPLSESGNIVCKNANDFDWFKFCKNEKNCEIFLIGNPPYIGPKKQKANHKRDIQKVFNNKKGSNILDYICCWFLLGAKYISQNNAKLAFVTTNSVIQGEQVSILWPDIFNLGVEIHFAHKSFDWSNYAKNKAGVVCAIIGLNKKNKTKDKKIFDDKKIVKAKFINAYLHDGPDVVVFREESSIAQFPKISFGNMPLDGGNLILSYDDKNELINENIKNKKFIKTLMGAEEFINGKKRYCLWINDNDLTEALTSKFISNRIKKVKNFRSNSIDKATQRLASRPHQFRDINVPKNNSIIVPNHTSGKREFLTVGFLDKEIIITNSSQVIYDPPLYIFTILSSRLHSAWAYFVGGALGTTPRYSIKLCYNTYPFPPIDKNAKKELEASALELIDIREKFTEKTLAELYDPSSMPLELQKIHFKIDNQIDKIFDISSNLEINKKIFILLEMYNKIKKENNLI